MCNKNFSVGHSSVSKQYAFHSDGLYCELNGLFSLVLAVQL